MTTFTFVELENEPLLRRRGLEEVVEELAVVLLVQRLVPGVLLEIDELRLVGELHVSVGPLAAAWWSLL